MIARVFTGSKKIVNECPHCGGEFVDYASNLRKFCSKECQYKGGMAKTHGESRTRLHVIWCCMKNRCRSRKKHLKKYYFDRSIKVCPEWERSYESFRDWALANGYKPNLEIDRIKNDKGYSPDNCRWVTRVQQMRNTRKRSDAKTSKYKGVSRHSQNRNWVVQLHANGKPIHVGVFNSEIEAAKAYDRAASKLYGKHAHFNFKEAGALR
jgi:AP2 domain